MLVDITHYLHIRGPSDIHLTQVVIVGGVLNEIVGMPIYREWQSPSLVLQNASQSALNVVHMCLRFFIADLPRLGGIATTASWLTPFDQRIVNKCLEYTTNIEQLVMENM